jgi:hypothetical protein
MSDDPTRDLAEQIAQLSGGTVTEHEHHYTIESAIDALSRLAFVSAPAQDTEEAQTSMDVGRPCAGCGSFGQHRRNCYLGDDTDG